ncbi:MAG: hypothetical protein IJ570_06110 [Prevotella sp.]|nr:hypothetical protein [Prevotella sp.]
MVERSPGLKSNLITGYFSHFQSVVAMNNCGCSMPCSVVNASNRSRRPSNTAASVDGLCHDFSGQSRCCRRRR